MLNRLTTTANQPPDFATYPKGPENHDFERPHTKLPSVAVRFPATVAIDASTIRKGYSPYRL
jgi:hypothetical protein